MTHVGFYDNVIEVFCHLYIYIVRQMLRVGDKFLEDSRRVEQVVIDPIFWSLDGALSFFALLVLPKRSLARSRLGQYLQKSPYILVLTVQLFHTLGVHLEHSCLDIVPSGFSERRRHSSEIHGRSREVSKLTENLSRGLLKVSDIHTNAGRLGPLTQFRQLCSDPLPCSALR